MYFDKIDYTIFEIANKNGFTPIFTPYIDEDEEQILIGWHKIENNTLYVVTYEELLRETHNNSCLVDNVQAWFDCALEIRWHDTKKGYVSITYFVGYDDITFTVYSGGGLDEFLTMYINQYVIDIESQYKVALIKAIEQLVANNKPVTRG